MNNAIVQCETEAWSQRVHSNRDFDYFKLLHNRIEPCIIYKMYKDSSERLTSEIIASIWSRSVDITNDVCAICDKQYNEPLTHLLSECMCTVHRRNAMYAELAKKFDIVFLDKLKSLNGIHQFLRLLGADIEPKTNAENSEKHLLTVTHAYIIDCMSYCIEAGLY